jgi:hypothetical protein
MITRKQIEEILDDTLEGDNPPDSAPTVVGKKECVNRLMELVKNCSIPDVRQQRELLLAYHKYLDSLNDHTVYNASESMIDDYLANNCG